MEAVLDSEGVLRAEGGGLERQVWQLGRKRVSGPPRAYHNNNF